MSKETEAGCGAVGAPVEPSVRPRAWLTSEPDGNDGDGSYGGMREGVELGAERPDYGTEPLVTLAQAEAMVAAERERWQEDLQAKREALRRASRWLHAAYDRPPQTPECIAMLAEVDAARDLGA